LPEVSTWALQLLGFVEVRLLRSIKWVLVGKLFDLLAGMGQASWMRNSRIQEFCLIVDIFDYSFSDKCPTRQGVNPHRAPQLG